jgi:hypothetical protein
MELTQPLMLDERRCWSTGQSESHMYGRNVRKCCAVLGVLVLLARVRVLVQLACVLRRWPMLIPVSA